MNNMFFLTRRYLFVSACSIVLFSHHNFAQVNDTNSDFQKGFNNFQIQINQQFDAFGRKNDSLFVQFLQKSWKEFNGTTNTIPSYPKPVNQPIYRKPDGKLNQIDIIKPSLNHDQEHSPYIEKRIPKEDAIDNLIPGVSFSFYGAKISLPETDVKFPVLSGITRQEIIDYFSKASQSAELNRIAWNLKERSKEYMLNDWGFVILLWQAARSYSTNRNEQVLFTWVGLLHCGYNVKVGYNSNRVYLLIPANVQLYAVSFLINNKAYYVLEPGLDPPKAEKLFIYEADYPGNKSIFSFLLSKSPQVGYKEILKTLQYEKTINLHLNEELMNLYSNYPPCELKVYFGAPLSGNAKIELDAFFLPKLEKKNNHERVEFLLNFVQQAIKYQTDNEQFGHERYLFADETLYYTAADCEDRAILLSKLISRYTNLETIGLVFPGHVSLAVNLTGSQQGKYVVYNNKRFYHCDPTYLGSTCGLLMPSLEKDVPQIIDYNRY